MLGHINFVTELVRNNRQFIRTIAVPFGQDILLPPNRIKNTCVPPLFHPPSYANTSETDIFFDAGWTNRRKATCLSLRGCTVHCKRAGRQVYIPGSSVDLSMILSHRPSPANPARRCHYTFGRHTCGLRRCRAGTLSRFQKRAKHPGILQRSRVPPRLLCHLAIFTLATNERWITVFYRFTMFWR